MTKNDILIELSISEKTKFGKQPFDAQSIPQKVFSTIWALEAEVNNGGFSQYFLNSAESVHFTTTALEMIGAYDAADICATAISVAFPEGLTQDEDETCRVVQRFSAKVGASLESCDQEFFTYPNDLTELLFSYVSKHPSEFGAMPDVSTPES